MAPDRVLQQDTTSADGRWRLRFERASGDYLVHIAALGHESFRKRVTASPTDSLVTVDATLVARVQQLAAVNVKASRPKPRRENDAEMPDGISAEFVPMGVSGAVPADLQGDLAAMAATIPGLALTPGGVSAFGLDPAQSSATLNGMSFPGASLPRNANTSTRFSTSTYDPSRGGFAGVETAMTLSPGSVNTSRRGNLTLDVPPLQVTDRTSARLGNRVTGGTASIGGSGTWVDDKWYYNASADVSRRSSDAVSLLDADPSLFALAAVSADTVARLLSTLPSLGIPVSIGNAPTQRVDERASFALRVDHAPYKPQSFQPNKATWALVALGNVQRADAQGFALTQAPTRGARTERALGVVQGIYSTFVDDYSLSETRTSLSLNHTSGTPYALLPGGSVLVASVLADGSLGASALGFGGNAALLSRGNQLAWETRTDYQWFPSLNHQLKITLQNKVDRYEEDASGNTLGSFSYASLADLAVNRPSSFARTLSEPGRRGGAWSGFAALGDQWKVSPTLRLLYGARLEGNRYLDVPTRNVALDNALGARTDLAPARVHVSPRLGFSWRYGGERAGYSGFSVSNIGTAVLSPTGLIRGGIGEFRSAMPVQLLSGPSVFTGIAGAARRISCVGPATPIPDWSAYATDAAAIPTTCLDIAGAAPFTDAAPSVQVVDPAYDAPRSWRANLGVLTLVKSIGVTVDGSLSLNRNQTGTTDLNFSGRQQFALTDDGRPVFATASSIDPASGLLIASDARRSAAFGRVTNLVGDLHSTSRQFLVNLAPQSIGSYIANATYTLASTTGTVRGFDGAAYGDPRVLEQGRTDFDVRHRFQLQLGKSLPHGFNVTMFVVAASGLPYSPLVNGDVNGDGISGDRAFIPDPARPPDARVGAAMSALLASAPSSARTCLQSQLGHAAARNSCEGPWTVTAAARIGIANASGPWGRRVNASLSITNPLAGLDQALHGEDNLHGWGASIRPDPVLLTVRGFDPSAGRFRYDVNPRFGSSNPAQTTLRVPFRATLDVRFDLGPSLAKQQLERALNRGRAGRPGTRLSADSIRVRFSHNVSDPYRRVMDEADSLLLSRDQMDSLRAASAPYAARVNALWQSLANELAALGDQYDATWATERTEETTDRAWEMARDEVPTIKRILTPLQFTLAPGEIGYLDKAKGKIYIRMYSY